MGLHIDALRLTKRELTDALSPSPETVADAQLAKAAWGFQAWLGVVDLELAADLAQALLQANIKRPGSQR